MPIRYLLLGGLAAMLSACIEPLKAPPCTSVTVTPVSTSGDTVTTNTGLRYVDGAAGRGLSAEWCQILAVQYDAYLLDGTKFDSSEANFPLIFTPGLGGFIDGLEQGVIGMRVEGTRRLIISPALGFGSQPRSNENGVVVVPGNSSLVFDIEVVQVGSTPPQ